MSRPAKHFYEFGRFRVDEIERRLLRDGETIPLPPKAFDTLLTLVRNSGHLLTKDELLHTVWPDTFVEENNLTQYISALRRALVDDTNGSYIETVPRLGYRFTSGVREIWDEDARVEVEKHATYRIVVKEQEREETEDDERTTEACTPSAARLAPWRKLTPKNVALAASLAVTLSVPFLLILSTSRRPKSVGETAEAPVKPLAFKSIAVLPFKLIGGSEDDEYLGLGIADTLITRLSRLKRISVRPTSAVERYTGARDLLAVGRELGVDAVLDGRIQRNGDRIRVTAQLLNVRDGTPLWAEEFDENLNAIFRVQDEVCAQVTRALNLSLSAKESARLIEHGTDNPEAYQAYLKGNYFFGKRTQENYKKAIEYFTRAIAIDRKYAQPYVGLANCYMFIGREPKSAVAETLKKALEIDDTIPEAYASLAFREYCDWDWQDAEKGFRRAIELNPNYATAHHWYAYYLATMGQFDEALVEIKQARDLDPLSIIINTDVGEILYLARRYDEAIEVLRSAVDLDPNFYVTHYLLGYAYEQKGLYQEAITELEKAVALFGNDRQYRRGWLGHAYALMGKKDEALKILDEVKILAKRPDATRFGPAVDMALTYAALGEKDQALEWVEKVCQQHDYYAIHMKMDPRFDILRSDPRFTGLLRPMNLTP